MLEMRGLNVRSGCGYLGHCPWAAGCASRALLNPGCKSCSARKTGSLPVQAGEGELLARMPEPPNKSQFSPDAATLGPGTGKIVVESGLSGALMPIATMLGPYRIDEHIGSGGMGVVYRARDTRLERNVAIKVIPARRSSPVLEAALLREAQLTSSLSHPGIVTIYDILFHGGTTCIVMEFVQGRPLQQLIPECGLPIDRALSMADSHWKRDHRRTCGRRCPSGFKACEHSRPR